MNLFADSLFRILLNELNAYAGCRGSFKTKYQLLLALSADSLIHYTTKKIFESSNLYIKLFA